jgi:hypothetical protein
MHFFCHAGLDEPAPYLIRGHPDVVPTKVGNHLKECSWFSLGILDSPLWREMTTFVIEFNYIDTEI